MASSPVRLPSGEFAVPRRLENRTSTRRNPDYLPISRNWRRFYHALVPQYPCGIDRRAGDCPFAVLSGCGFGA
jgi:hypothetical protein